MRFTILLFLFTSSLFGQSATIKGRVLDFQTREPIARASVSVRDQGIAATTDQDGNFELSNVRAGSVELYIGTVGYGLLRKRVDATPASVLNVELLLGQEALKHTEQITVTAEPFAPANPDAPSQYSLNNTEIRNLSTALADDPLRAVQNLPGVAANQDFYSQFAVRGVGLDHIGLFIDGVVVDHPLHAVQDQRNLGSLSILNGDLVESMSLMSGAFPAMYGDRTGAVLDVETREGGRDRVSARVNADFLGASGTVEGPLGKSKKASWLVSVRKSYLDYLLNRLNDTLGLTLGYEDVEGRLTYDVSEHHKISLTTLWGDSRASRNPFNSFNEQNGFFTRANSANTLATLRWNWILCPNTLANTQVFWTRDTERDRNPLAQPLLDTASNQSGFREDVTHQFSPAHKLEAGVSERRLSERLESQSIWDYATGAISPNLVSLAHYSKSAWQPGGYLQDTLTLFHQRLTLQFGGRWDRFSATGQNVWLPHAGATFQLSSKTHLSAAAGEYAQFPSLQNLYGEFGTPGLRADRALHESASLDHFFTDKLRLHLEFYNRQERDVVYSPLTEFRALGNGQFAFPQPGPVLGNSLNGYSRGLEISLQRRSANRLSGWISYSRGYSKYWQPGTSLSFPGDYDQRNTFSAYGAYRIAPTVCLSASARYGSGFPLPGFLSGSASSNDGSGQTESTFQISTFRNRVRLPYYERTDLRASKVLNRDHFKLTIYAEVANILSHKNWRYYDLVAPPDFSTSGRIYATRNTIMPILPTAGFTFEF